MEVIAILKEVSQPRVLQGNQGTLTVVDIKVDAGVDEFVMSAFDKMAESFTSGTIKVNSVIKVRATASVRSKDGKNFQSMRVDACKMLIDTEKVF